MPDLVACQSVQRQVGRVVFASATAHSTRSSGAGSGSICLANKSPVECSPLAFSHSLAEFVVGVGAPATPTSRPHLAHVAEVRECASRPFGRILAPPCLVHGQAFERAVNDGAGKSGARVRLDAALEAAEDGQIAGLQVRSASWRRVGTSPAWRSRWSRWRGCWPCPREGSTIVLPCPGSSRSSGRPGVARSWSSLPSRSRT